MTDSILLANILPAAQLATGMTDKIALMWPEIILFATTCVVLIVGLSPSATIRKSTGAIAAVGLAIATLMAHASPPGQGGFGAMMPYAKALIGIVGLLMVGLMAGTVDRRFEAAIESGRATYQPLLATRAEFYAFFLFSLTGAMLCAGANDLIWLFLALELTSLPTYVMVVISTRGTRSQESGVKYFFLGALGAAIFLMGFALLFGGTGSTMLFGTPGDPGIAEILAYQTLQFNGINPIAMAGLVLAVIGIGFKIAAVPMHFYTADVYQGASSTVAAFLAFVPKTAGFIALIVVLGTVGWSHDTFAGEGGQLPGVLRTVLWVMAVMTMFAGNILALVQTSAKRMLAYSSIAHSGYMLVGLIAGPGDGTFRNNGIAAVLFYLT
ncbi:MAG: NADH-quinone oxidoreductase subunit N, partial [Planctomycetota bacterium]